MSIMKNLFILSLVVIVFASCSNTSNGELIGVQNRPIWNPTDPYGMVFVPQGSFNMGPGDQDVPYAHVTQHKTVSVDESEVTQSTNTVKTALPQLQQSAAMRIL